MKKTLLIAPVALLLALTVGAGAAYAAATPIPGAPTVERPVVDQTQTLTGPEIDKLSSVIADGRAVDGRQTAVLVIDTTGGPTIEEYGIDVARSWGVGEADKDNGLLVLVAVDDHKLRIEVGRGLEGEITDAVAGRIGDQLMVPHMKEGDLYGALLAGVTALQSKNVAGTVAAAGPSDAAVAAAAAPWLIGGIVIIFGLAVLAVLSSFKTNRRRRANYLSKHGSMEGYEAYVAALAAAAAPYRSSSYSSSHDDSSSFGSGSSFGGGGFSGGGSSSGW